MIYFPQHFFYSNIFWINIINIQTKHQSNFIILHSYVILTGKISDRSCSSSTNSRYMKILPLVLRFLDIFWICSDGVLFSFFFMFYYFFLLCFVLSYLRCFPPILLHTYINRYTLNIKYQNMTIELFKKGLKTPTGQSESVYRRRTDNTMAKKKYERTNNDQQNIHIKLKTE